MEASHYGEHKHPTLLPFLVPDKDHWEGEREQTAHQPPVFLINIVPVVRLCLIMHDCYQQQTPLNEAPLKRNTIIPHQGLRKKDKIVFLLRLRPLYCATCSEPATVWKWRCRVQRKMDTERIKMGAGGDAFWLHLHFYYWKYNPTV